MDQQPPLPPKRPLSAFFQYKKAVFEEVKSQNPDMKLTDITKVISQMWKNLDEVTQKSYQEWYRLEIQAYEEKYGKIPLVCNQAYSSMPLVQAKEEDQRED
eukprot:TRINITY_DN11037_c0_g1_i3.p1 TRINITY_DN11037_c0_g1~~TRINITY_DN11037_c0_g1_i3.p1  ORF type:complete len:101 (+),score=18.15 TRINITY_DN11037_c0_g1_i3:111-413(+)